MCLGGGSGRRVGLKIQSGSPLVPVQVRLKAILTPERVFFYCRILTRGSKFAKLTKNLRFTVKDFVLPACGLASNRA